MGIGELSGKPNEMLGGNLRWTSIPCKRSSNTPSRLMLWKPGLAPEVGSCADFTLPKQGYATEVVAVLRQSQLSRLSLNSRSTCFGNIEINIKG